MSSRPHIATLAAAAQRAGDERCQLRLGWRDEALARRFHEALLSLFGAAEAQVQVPGPTGWRSVESDEAARRLRARPTALRFRLGNTSIESSADAASLTVGPGPLIKDPVELTWIQADPVLRSPLPILAVPLLDGSVHVDLLHALVALAHACSALDHAQATVDGTSLRWSATAAGQPLVATAHGAQWRPANDGPADALRFLAEPVTLPDLPAALHAAADPIAQAAAFAKAVPYAARLAPLDGAPAATFHVPPPADAILRLVPEADAVRVELEATLDPDRARWALCHAAAHLRLGHVRPGDTHGHWDTWETITNPGRRWDREVRERLPEWRQPGAPTRASLDECTPQEKAWLVLLDHIGRMVGQARSLHPAAEAYQAAAYQRQAAQRLVAQLEEYGGAMLCDGVGLGKTYVATTILVHYANTWREAVAHQGRSLADDPFRVTILSPNSVVSTWTREAIPPLGHHGVVPAHVRVVSHTKLSRILPTSQVLERSPSEPSEIEHLLLSDLVVVDEAHNFRSVGARRTAVLRDLLRLQPRKDVRRKVLLLTATPVNNSLEDLRQQAALLFSKPLWFNDNVTADGYRRRVAKDVEERVDRAARARSGDVATILVHGSADARFSYAPDFRDDLQFGVQVPRIGDYLKEQEKRLATQQAAVRAAMQVAQPTLEPVRIAGDLLDRIVVQRSRALCKQIEREQGSDVRLLFRPDAPAPEKLVYEDVYDDTRDVLARFLPMFETGEPSDLGAVAPLSLKVYMWADVRDGTRDATEVSSVVGLQRVLVLKRLESSPVAFLITLLRLLALYGHRLKQLADLCHHLGDRGRAASLEHELTALLDGLAPVERDRIDLLLTGKASGHRGRELLARWSQAHTSAKAAADSDDPPPAQLDLWSPDDAETATRREQLDRLWGLREDLARDLGTLLATAPGLADIVFGRFDVADWPRKFINGGQGVDWPTSAAWAQRVVTDGKLRRLVGRLLRARAEGQKAIVFSQFTDTLAYVSSVLRATRGLERREWTVVTGMLGADAGRAVSQDEVLDLVDRSAVVSGETEDRDLVIHAFAPYYRLGPHRPRTSGASPEQQQLLVDAWRQGWVHALQHPTDVLLATDVLAEGVNLQDAALLVNYDVHWNPVRMIQRAGRIDRRLNAAIEDARAFPDVDDLAAELGATVPRYWWHDHPGAAPATVNLLLPDELEAALQLRERIANKTLAIDFTLGLEQGTGAEADWMADYRYRGISALNAWQGDRAIEQVAGYQERIKRLLAERTIDPAWVQRWNGWLREEGAGEDGPIVAWAAIGRRGAATTEHSRKLQPALHDGVPHWLWTSPNPGESLLNFWIALDGATWPPATRVGLPWSEHASRPVSAEDLLGVAQRVVDAGAPLLERGREIGKPLRQGLTAISAGYLGSEADRLLAQATAYRLLQLRRLAPDPPERTVPRRGIARACPHCGHPPGMHKCCPTCGAHADGEPEVEAAFGFRQMRTTDGSPYETPQPWCRACRKLDHATRPLREEDATC